MFFALILTSGFAGNLRGLLLSPGRGKPIDTMEDIVNSNLPWTIVLYGIHLDNELSKSVDKVEKAFWEGKTEVEYDEFPYELMKSVVEGRIVMVEWKPMLETLISTELTR